MHPEPSLVEDFLPPAVAAAFRPLRKRLLFQNEYVQMLLTGLRAGESVRHFRTEAPILLIVAYGGVEVLGREGWTELLEGEEFRIEPGYDYTLRAPEESDLLFFVPHHKNREGMAQVERVTQKNLQSLMRKRPTAELPVLSVV